MSKTLDDILDIDMHGDSELVKAQIKALVLDLTHYVPGMKTPEATIAIIRKRIEDL